MNALKNVRLNMRGWERVTMSAYVATDRKGKSASQLMQCIVSEQFV